MGIEVLMRRLALERAVAFRRFGADDVRAILEAGVGIPGLAAPGQIIVGSYPRAHPAPVGLRGEDR